MGTLISILKRFINSDFTKPLNTLIDEVKATLALIKAKTDTITSSVITQAQANNLDATISSRQANAGLTTTHASRIDASISSRALETTAQAIKAKTDLIVAGMGGIKSIQRGSNALSSATITQAISSVDINKSTINLMLKASLNQDASKITISAEFASSSSISITSNYTGTHYAIWEVIEFV